MKEAGAKSALEKTAELVYVWEEKPSGFLDIAPEGAMKFIDPRTDFAFKKIFGNEHAKDVLISFLNAVLQSTRRTPS